MTSLSKIAASLTVLAACAQAAATPITAVVRMKSKVSMEELARRVSDPQSPEFRHFYTPEQIRQLSGPDEAQYQQTLNQLRADGFQVVHESRTHLWVTVRAEAATYESVFSTALASVGKGLHRPMMQMSVPNHLSLIASVIGMDNTRHMHPQLHILGPVTKQAAGISQAAIKQGYDFNPIYQAGITGKDQNIDIATYDGFNIDDVKQFYKDSNLPATPTVDQVQFNGTPTYDPNSAGETELDSEFSGMIAPGAHIHVYASATNDDAGELQMFTAILDDNKAQIVNYSWGGCESQVDPQHAQEMTKIFDRAVAQGVNILVASGDSGSDSCQNGSVAADWPAGSPDVVAVGGTSFYAQGNSRRETAWSCDDSNPSCSGGGISGLFNLPSFQSSLSAPYVKRSYPDVAFNADPNTGEAIYYSAQGQSGYFIVGGTSMAAPQWAGLLALVGEARAKQNKPAVGYLNPLIYGATAGVQSKIFDDITSGSNGAYTAAAGWDAVTGLGTPNAAELVDYLSQ